jgi:hypothetical protein
MAQRQAHHFREVVEGQDAIEKIVSVPRNREGKPSQDVVVQSVVIERV